MYDERPSWAEQQVTRGNRTWCETMGLSVYTNPDDAVECAKKYRNLGTNIAKVNLVPISGKVLPTDGGCPSHNTWWKAEGFDPTQHSEIIASLK